MTEIYKPQPGGRPDQSKTSREAGARRPLQRARDWSHRQWQGARETLKHPAAHKKAAITGGVFLALAIALAILIAIWDWNWFRGPLARFASARMNREVQITGNLDVKLWSWTPGMTVEGVTIADPKWAGGGRMAQFDRIAVRVRLLPLLKGQVDLPLLQFDRPQVKLYVDQQGRKTWDFSDGKKKDEPTRLPPIRNFIINDGQLQYRDVKKGLTFGGTINARERLNNNNPGFQLSGQGAINKAPFNLRVTGGPLLNIERDKPYPFDADLRAGDTVITARGAVPKPFDLGQFHMNATARGPDMAQIYGLTGVALPNTPPYSLRARVVRDDKLYKLTNIGGKVGDSDLSGTASVQLGRERPMIKANLLTRSLDFDDLGAFFGGSPSTKPGETASPEQKAVAQTLASQQRILPDSTLAVERIRAVDADVTYKAVSIRDTPINLTAASVRVKLNDGLLRAEPLTLSLPQGQVAGMIQLNARKATPVTDLDLRLTGARLEQLLPVKFGGGQPFAGALVGRAKLTGEGNSVHKAFANADGQVTLVVPGGEIREAFAELMGVNVTKGLGLLLSKDQSMTPIRCGVANFQARDGVLTADRFVFDTGPVVVTGGGTINMDTERMAFRAQGHSKEFRLVRLLLPVTAQGPLLKPKLGVEPGKAIAQGGIAVALGSLISPLAAILPFIDPGLAKDANCSALLTEASGKGAPVKASQVRAVPPPKH